MRQQTIWRTHGYVSRDYEHNVEHNLRERPHGYPELDEDPEDGGPPDEYVVDIPRIDLLEKEWNGQ